MYQIELRTPEKYVLELSLQRSYDLGRVYRHPDSYCFLFLKLSENYH